jgi:drug/metabolite transporter (DMT)-like permease
LTETVNVRAHASLLLVVVVWAGSFSVIKALLDDGFAAQDVALLRYAIAAPGFALVLGLARGLPGLTRRDTLRVAAAGLLVVVGYHLCLNVGESHTTSGVAGLVVALAPGITLVLSTLVGLDSISLRQVAGLAIAFAGGAVVVALGTGESLSLQSAKGPLVVLGAPLAFALYNVLLKPLLGRYDLLALTAATSLVGTLGLLPFVGRSTIESAEHASAGDAALLLYLGLLATLVGYVLWNLGLRGLGPTRAVSYTYAISPLAVLIGAAVLGEPLSVFLALGGALVVGGIALTQRRARREPRARLGQWRPEASAHSRSRS